MFGTDHQVRYLDLDAARDLMPQVLGSSTSRSATRRSCRPISSVRFTREHVTVALSGDGGDELFAGYDPFKALAPAQLYRQLVPRGLHRGIAASRRPPADLDAQHEPRFQASACAWLAVLSARRVEPGLDGTARAATCRTLFEVPLSYRGPLRRGDRTVGKRSQQGFDRPDARILHHVLPAGRYPDQGRIGPQ